VTRFGTALLLACACRRPPPPPVAPEPAPELPPLPALVLAFENELDREPPGPAEAPSESLLRWDFAPSARAAYRIDQHVLNRSTSKDKHGAAELRSSLRGDGYAEIFGSTSRVGAAHFKMTLRESIVNGQRQEVNRQPAAKIEYEVSEDGSIRESKKHSGGDSQALELLFALPAKNLRHGERAERPIRRTAAYRETGESVAQLTGFVLLRGRTCARLVTETTIDLAPPAADGFGIGRMRTKTVAYFDVRDRRFLQSEAAASYAWHSRQLIQGVWTVGTLESHTLLRARWE